MRSLNQCSTAPHAIMLNDCNVLHVYQEMEQTAVNGVLNAIRRWAA